MHLNFAIQGKKWEVAIHNLQLYEPIGRVLDILAVTIRPNLVSVMFSFMKLKDMFLKLDGVWI